LYNSKRWTGWDLNPRPQQLTNPPTMRTAVVLSKAAYLIMQEHGRKP
jgi:hypothetical protein